MTGGFDQVVMVDWSARSQPSPARPTKDAIFIAVAEVGRTDVTYHRTRVDALACLTGLFDGALAQGRRVLAGFDFPFGYPRGFARAVTGTPDPFAVWAWLAARIEDDDRNANNRLEVADLVNAALPGLGPFWSHPVSARPRHIPFRKPGYDGLPFAERRQVERRLPGASTCFQLFGAGAVASQSLLGLPRLQHLRLRYREALAVRPFEDRDAPIILSEIYPSLLAAEVKRRQAKGEIPDAAQVRVMAQAFAGLHHLRLDAMLLEGCREEGWILGLDHEAALVAALRT